MLQLVIINLRGSKGVSWRLRKDTAADLFSYDLFFLSFYSRHLSRSDMEAQKKKKKPPIWGRLLLWRASHICHTVMNWRMDIDKQSSLLISLLGNGAVAGVSS